MGLKSLTPYRPNYNQSGAGRDRTDDLVNAIHALSQLSYSPIFHPNTSGKFKSKITNYQNHVLLIMGDRFRFKIQFTIYSYLLNLFKSFLIGIESDIII